MPSALLQRAALLVVAALLSALGVTGCGGGSEQAAKKTPASCPAYRPPQPAKSHWWRKAQK